MCIEITKAKRAEKDIIVWKVMEDSTECSHFRYAPHTIHTPFIGLKEYDMLHMPAMNFAKTFISRSGTKARGGYHCFDNYPAAQHYKIEIETWCPFVKKLFIKSYTLPKGEWYAEGCIIPGLLGEGMRSIRARRLKEVEK